MEVESKDSGMNLSARDRFRICEQAALRLIRLHENPSKEARTEYLSWSRLSAHHVHELMFAQAVSSELDGMDPQRAIDVDALPTLPELPSQVGECSVGGADTATRRRSSGRWVAALAATVVVITLAWILGNPYWGDTHSFGTGMGEQRSIKLDDGSLMALNTGSRVRVQFSESAREIQLIQGEALFVVQHDPNRPFRVATDSGTVLAVGTQFNVYRREGSTRVSVIEGAVRILAASSDDEDSSAQLVAGDEATISRGRISRAERPDVQQAVAWRARQLVFRDRGLADVAAEFNRYNKAQIHIDDETLHARSISGVFDADDAQPLIDFLQRDPGLEVVRSEDGISIRRRLESSGSNP